MENYSGQTSGRDDQCQLCVNEHVCYMAYLYDEPCPFRFVYPSEIKKRSED